MNKKYMLIIICLSSLILISSVNAQESQNKTILEESSNYQITSNLSNNDIQKIFDNAKDGDTLEFKDKQYNNLSLVVDKKLNIISKCNSQMSANNKIPVKAKDLGITNTFAFYFTSKSAGSVLSGITIKASKCDYNIVIDSADKTTIENNIFSGGKTTVLIKNSEGVNLKNNIISKAGLNGVQLQNIKNCIILKNTISHNGKSGIETSDIYYSIINNNTIHHNDYNGISMYNVSYGNTIKYNDVHDNDNGIFINSTSYYDVINANSFTYNWNDISNDEIGGGSETGNGLLFGSGFKTAREGDSSRLVFKYNVLAHNQNYQAKNNPALSKFKLGDNWFDSADSEDTFVCPFLLAGIMKMDTISVKNGIGLQMYDTKGNPVQEFGTFDTTVNINGNTYSAKFVNGKAVIDANLDPDKEYDVQVNIGGKPVNYKYKVASGETGNNKDSQTSKTTEGNAGASGFNSQFSSNSNSGISKGTGQNGTSKSSHYTNSDKSGVHGKNASGNYQDSSDNGNSALTNGDVDAGDASEGEVSREGKAYEVVPQSKISKEITDTSGIIVLCIVSIMSMLIYGYWREEDYE
ncbi:MAG: right-handed parallel beta-helix repeat-containing protein [Methanobrevibacter thaueri]|nr:right-handed parallel beta-helix repeat-containing protein [Methanobrevibacter thaueri]